MTAADQKCWSAEGRSSDFWTHIITCDLRNQWLSWQVMTQIVGQCVPVSWSQLTWIRYDMMTKLWWNQAISPNQAVRNSGPSAGSWNSRARLAKGNARAKNLLEFVRARNLTKLICAIIQLKGCCVLDTWVHFVKFELWSWLSTKTFLALWF
jgi:hypothetical protein